ncbi:MAG: curli production assembly protein CsgG [Methylocystaceae bacterium]|nr:curli production assembly protein CsgG [Methylocystaceae bacterium]
MFRLFLSIACLILLASCVTPATQQQPKQAPVSQQAMVEAQKSFQLRNVTKKFKRKIAIGRFTNETRYGKTFLRDGDQDPLGKQASDMLSARLVETNGFLIFERPDISKLQKEAELTGQSMNLIGVDALILGSVTEFGRSTEGQTGFLSSTKRQRAHSKVDIRLVDPKTGYVFFSATGSGQATSEVGDVAGFGNRAEYDSTLNDKAIGASINDVINDLIAKLDERPWKTDILKVEGNRIFISGGTRQGLKIGDLLSVQKAGEKIKSGQSGFEITLPSTQVATLRIEGTFGENETNEGSFGSIVSGSINPSQISSLFVSDTQ